MKYLIASDLHGSAACVEKLLDAWEREAADGMILLGDILYHGPRNALPKDYDTKKVMDMLNPLAYRITAVRGNCDAEVDQMVLAFPVMADFINLIVDGRRFFLTHGHRYGPHQPPLDLARGDVMLFGHTHVPECLRTPEGAWCLNPGSVSIPKNGSPNSYMMYDGGLFRWKTLDGAVFRELSLDGDA